MNEKLLTIATGENQQQLSDWLIENYKETNYPKVLFPKERIMMGFLPDNGPRYYWVNYADLGVIKYYLTLDERGSCVFNHNKPLIDFITSIINQYSLTEELQSFETYFSWALLDDVTIFIDRPELGLPSGAQRLFARLIARLVNFGVKVVITTHSDFIIRQLNNLIILGSTDNISIRDELMKQYDIKVEELLSFEVIEIEDSEQQTMDIIHNLVC